MLFVFGLLLYAQMLRLILIALTFLQGICCTVQFSSNYLQGRSTLKDDAVTCNLLVSLFMSWQCPWMCCAPFKMPPGEKYTGWIWIWSYQTFLLCVVSYQNGISCETSSPRLPLKPFLFQNKSARKWSQSLLRGCFLPCLFTPTSRLIGRDDGGFPGFRQNAQAPESAFPTHYLRSSVL